MSDFASVYVRGMSYEEAGAALEQYEAQFGSIPASPDWVRDEDSIGPAGYNAVIDVLDMWDDIPTMHATIHKLADWIGRDRVWIDPAIETLLAMDAQ